MTKKMNTKDAVGIKCCYCDVKDTCSRRQRKESEERKGLITYCLLTPNRPQAYKKKRRKKRKPSPKTH